MQITGSTIVITGGGQGLGRAMALYLAERGAHLALVDLNPETLNATVEDCEKLGAQARAYTANVTSEAEVETVFARIAEDLKQIDVLINNAGILRDGLLIKAKEGKIEKRMSVQQWQSVIDVNLTGVFLCGREAATHMVNGARGGVIINMSSVARAGNAGQTNYAAAKAGVSAMTVTWAQELARYKIRCAAIAPGGIATEMFHSMRPDMRERFEAQIPLRRAGEPNEIAHTVAFIIENDYVSGRVMEVDGGFRM